MSEQIPEYKDEACDHCVTVHCIPTRTWKELAKLRAQLEKAEKLLNITRDGIAEFEVVKLAGIAGGINQYFSDKSKSAEKEKEAGL